MGDCVVLTPGRPQPTSGNGLLSCLNTSERLYFCERNVSTRVWLVISARRQRLAYLQSPIAFIISWLPKQERTIPPAASACHLNFSISRYNGIVSSPLFTDQRRFWRILNRHTYLRIHENNLMQGTESTHPQCPPSERGSRLLSGSNRCCH